MQGGVLVGYFRDKEFICNPADRDVLQVGDKAVLLTQDDDVVRLPTKVWFFFCVCVCWVGVALLDVCQG